MQYLAGKKDIDELLFPIESVTKGAKTVRGYFVGISSSKKVAYVRSVESEGVNTKLLEIPYDALVLCTGVPYSSPIRNSFKSISYIDRVLEIEGFAAKIREAKSVIVAGGGETGVEMMGEIVTRLNIRDKLLISRNKILNHLPASAGKYALKWFQDNGVEVQVGGTIQHCDDTSVTLSNGEVLTADVVIDCTNRGWSRSPPRGTVTGAAPLSKVLYQTNESIWALGQVSDATESEITVLGSDGVAVTVPNHKNNAYALSRPVDLVDLESSSVGSEVRLSA